MSTGHVRRWGIGLGVAVGGAIVAATVAGMGSAHAESSGLAGVLVSSLGDVPDHDLALLNAELGLPNAAEFSVGTLVDAKANLTDSVDLLTANVLLDPSTLGRAIGLQDRSIDALERLQDAQDNILAHTGSWSGPWSETIENLFLDPVNQQWLTASENALTADQAIVDALLNDAGASDMFTAKMDLFSAEFELLGAQFSSLPIIFVSSLFGDLGL